MEVAGHRGFRADIEGLRAVAVGIVVAFHAGVTALGGGFVGVDVFFVLSGFLITGLLLDERERTGTISLPGFWSRRVRRLLPAACLTLVTTTLVAQFVLPPLQRRAVTIDGFFSAVFLANIRFAGTLGDYFANQLAQDYPSPFLHFWSLAVEEQFYVLWPVTVLLVGRFGRRPRRTLAVVATTLAVGSFALSAWWTPRQPAAAFYLLPTRICELLAGALLAIAGPAVSRSLPAASRAALGWIGLAGIAAASVIYSETTAFPGTAVLLPVLATVALIVSGSGATLRRGPQRLLGARPMQWIGRRSYAIYLWHWPALVLYQAHEPDLSVAQRAAAVAASLILAELSTRFVEDPVRFAKALGAPARRGLALGLGLTASSVAVIGLSWTTQPALDSGEVATAVTIEPIATPSTASTVAVGEDASLEDASLDDAPPDDPPLDAPLDDVPSRARLTELEGSLRAILEDAATTTEVPANLRPALTDAERDTAQVYHESCISLGDESEVFDCRYGVVGSSTKIVLFGDSHAAQWFPALETIASERGAELVVLLKGGCPVADIPSTRPDLIESCPAWRGAAIDRVLDLRPTLVITSSLSGYTTDEARWERGLADVLQQLRPATDRLVVLLDTPRPAGSPPICLSDHLTSANACVTSPDEAIQAERADAERAAAESADAEVVDPTPWLCSPTVCPVIVGDALMYRDADHITTVASRLLKPLLDAALFP